MKFRLVSALALIAGSAAFVIAHDHPATMPTTQPVNKMCAVDPEHKADPTVTAVYKGKTYAFCCEDCIPMFQKDPEKYKDAK